MQKFEEDYHENQFFDNYFIEINKIIAPNLRFDTVGNIVGINSPLILKDAEKNILLSYLWKIEFTRNERAAASKQLAGKIDKLQNQIATLLKKGN